MWWVPTSSPLPCRTHPSPQPHQNYLCCYSTEFTLRLPWAGCCLHISCGMCSFPGAWGMACILMHRPALTPDRSRASLMRRLTPKREATGLPGRRPQTLQAVTGGRGAAGWGQPSERANACLFKTQFYHQMLQVHWFKRHQEWIGASIKAQSDQGT